MNLHVEAIRHKTGDFKTRALKTSLVYWLTTVLWVLMINRIFGPSLVNHYGAGVVDAVRIFLFATVTSVVLYYFIVRQGNRSEKELRDRDRAEEALRENELHLKAAQSLAHIGSWRWDRVRRKATWSDEMFRIFKIDPAEFDGDPSIMGKRIHPDDLGLFEDMFRTLVELGKPLPRPVECRIVWPTGEIRHVVSLNPPVDEASRDRDKVMGVIQDITEQKRSENALRESEARLREAEELTHVGSGSWYPKTDTTVWSDEMFRIAGRDLSLPPPTYAERASIYTPESWIRFDRALRNTIETGEPYDLEIQVRRPDGEIRDVRVRGAADRDARGELTKVIGTMQDITEWKRTEKRVRLQAIALQSAANAIAITDKSGAILYVNPAFTGLTGYSPEEVIGKNMRILNSGKQHDLFFKTLWDSIASGQVWHGQVVNRRKNGTLYDEEETITPVRIEGEQISHFIAVKSDITERIRSEEKLRTSMTQLQELSTRLERVREEERKSISHEVHDELGQVLTAVKMNLLALEGSETSDTGEFKRKTRATVYLLDEAMKTVRDISARLRPGILDYLGLVPAIEWQTEQFRRQSGIKCTLNLPQEGSGIDEERSTILFRILQESLTNVARHAHASNVSISLSEFDGEFMMSVIDDGVGIREDLINNPRSFGLMGIRERLRPVGGSCEIRRHKNGGTEILVSLPKHSGEREVV